MSNVLAASNFDTDQHTAIDLCMDVIQRIVGITGEAGTGKTMVLGESVNNLFQDGFKIGLCAPTGRAAARIREATGHRAVTCHRMLGYGPPDPDDPEDFSFPLRNRANPVPYHGLFVDESSMLSEDLYRQLIDALPKGGFIRFFGDMNQLPPVNVTGLPPFVRILEKFPKVILTKNYRSTDGIVQAAQKILRGQLPMNNNKFTILKYPAQFGLTILDKFIDEDMLHPKRSQVITPTRIGKLGSNVINGYIQNKINSGPRTLDLEYPTDTGDIQRIRLRPNDKILWTKNDYNLGLFNGMIGRVIDFDKLSGDIATEFEGRDYLVPSVLERFDEHQRSLFRYDPRKFIDLAYAITTHKSQGSEFDRVLVLLYYSGVLSRQNFYTAVTRGRQKVTVIAGPGGLKGALKNDPVFEEKK